MQLAVSLVLRSWSTGTASGVYGNNNGATNTGSGIFGTNSSTSAGAGVKGTETGYMDTNW